MVITEVLRVLRERSVRVGSPVTAQVRAAAEATMLELAASLDPAQLATAGAVLVERLDPDWCPFGDDPVLAEQARRVFTATPLPQGGVRLGGELDGEAWAVLDAALSPLSAPRPETAEGKDPRPASPRRAEVCGHHHRLIHHSDWALVIAADGLPTFIPPPWVSADIACTDPTWRITLRERHPRAA